MLSVHHVGIQTDDFESCLGWYLEFFEAKQVWQLDRFSQLTLSRLPGIGRLTEVAVAGLRFHLFDRSTHSHESPAENCYQFQHVCIEVEAPEELTRIRDRWLTLYQSGKYTFARDDQPTEIAIDADGIHSLYVLDVNGLEFEFTYVPGNTGA